MKKLIGTRSLTLTHSRALSLSHSLPPSILSLSLSLSLSRLDALLGGMACFFQKTKLVPEQCNVMKFLVNLVLCFRGFW